MGSSLLFEDSYTYDDDTRYVRIATSVPPSEAYQEGIKYRFPYMDEEGRTLLRYDNFPGHPEVERHHYHTPEGVFDDLEYSNLRSHVEQFFESIDDIRNR